MRRERWLEVKEIAQDALDLPEQERGAFLKQACGDDDDLLREVAALLSVSETEAAAFDALRISLPGTSLPALTPGDRIGPYQVQRALQPSGMGAVYLATDERHDRAVALKLVPRNRARVSSREHQLLAQLNHPYIATLFDSKSLNDETQYMAMEYVDGLPITEHCNSQSLDLDDRLALFRKVCEAVGYAHRRLIVHRDLKPGNILVVAPDTPKLLDFGIAKRISPVREAQPATLPGERPLTLAFASPEQLSGEHTSTATDIYSLGVLLCLLLTGRLPYDVKNHHDLPWAIRHMEPRRPSQLVEPGLKAPVAHTGRNNANSFSIALSPKRLRKRLSGDIDAIVMTALRKEPDQRYATVQALSEDIRRHLEDKPILALHASRANRAKKLFQRHRTLILGGASFVLLLLALAVGLLLSQMEARRQRDMAEFQAARATQVKDFVVDVFRFSDPWRTPDGGSITARSLLDNAAQELETELVEQPLLKAELLDTIGEINTQLALYEEAERPLRAALDLRIQAAGEESLETAESLNSLGRLASERNNLVAAEDFYRRALKALAGRTARPEEELLATVHNNLGVVYYKTANYPLSEEHYRSSLSVRQRLFGDRHEDTGISMNNLAVLLNVTGRYEEALSMHRRALSIRRDLFGNQHPSVALSLGNLARVLRNRTEFAAARALDIEALEVNRTVLGRDHPNVARALNNLAMGFLDAGRIAEAASMLREAIAIATDAFGTEHLRVARYSKNLSKALWETGEWEKADELLHQSLETYRGVLSDIHPLVASTLQTIALRELQRNNGANAEARAREALSIVRAAFDQPTDDLVIALNNLGRVLVDRGNYGAAQETLQEASEVASDALGTAHWLYGAVLVTQAKLELAQKNYSEARVFIDEALGVLFEELGDDHWRVASAQGVLVHCVAHEGRQAEAEEMLKSAVSTIRAQRGPYSLAVRDILLSAATLYQGWGMTEKADEYERLLEEPHSDA